MLYFQCENTPKVYHFGDLHAGSLFLLSEENGEVFMKTTDADLRPRVFALTTGCVSTDRDWMQYFKTIVNDSTIIIPIEVFRNIIKYSN